MRRILSLFLCIAVLFCVSPALADDSAAHHTAVLAMLDANNYRYTLAEGDNGVNAEFTISSKMEDVNVWIFSHDLCIRYYSDFNQEVPAAYRDEISRLLTLINKDIDRGLFYMDYETGLIGHRLDVYLYGVTPSQHLLEQALYVTVNRAERYGDLILSVMDGSSTAQAAFAAYKAAQE